MSKLKIGFAGTSKIATAFLDELLSDNRFDLQIILTKYSPAPNRNINPLNVYRFVLEHKIQIPMHTPHKISELSLELLQNLDAMLVVSYGHKIPEIMLSQTNWINMHASLLPSWRGAAPIQYALRNGDRITGLTSTIMAQQIDSGPILEQILIPIHPQENFETLQDKMMRVGPNWFADSVCKFLSGELLPQEQNHNHASFAPSIKEIDQQINWNQKAESILNQIRSLPSAEACFISINSKKIKILKARAVQTDSVTPYSPGQIIHNRQLIIQCLDVPIRLEQIIPESSRLMGDQDFCRGHKIQVGTYVDGYHSMNAL